MSMSSKQYFVLGPNLTPTISSVDSHNASNSVSFR